jgi:pimeloyl-ACP methyl ester carboxylesterase
LRDRLSRHAIELVRHLLDDQRSGEDMAWTRTLLIFATLLAQVPARADAGTIVPWRLLKPGPYRVGFKSTLVQDYGRAFALPEALASGGNGEARPILVNVWYPAANPKGLAMRARDYLEIPTPTKELRPFVDSLRQFELRVISTEVNSSELTSTLTTTQQQLVERFLDNGTAAVRDAPEAQGAFPLVLYHPGLSGSFEDNSALLELLASFGFVVVDSAYQPASGWSLGIDGDLRLSHEDLAFLLQYLHPNPHIDGRRFAVVGHSYGATASMTFAMQNNRVGAVVSLDSTLDYFKPSELPSFPRESEWGAILDSSGLAAPLLAAAREEASFALLGSYAHSNRIFLRVKDLKHNDFIWHGIAGALLASDADAEHKREQYEAIAAYVLHFLEARLKNDVDADAWLKRGPAENQLKDVAVRVETKNATMPMLTASNVIAKVFSDGPARAAAYLRAEEKKSPGTVTADLMEESAWGLEQRNHREEALSLLQLSMELHDSLNWNIGLMYGDILAAAHRNQEASTMYRTALKGLAKVQSGSRMEKVKHVLESRLDKLSSAKSAVTPPSSESTK